MKRKLNEFDNVETETILDDNIKINKPKRRKQMDSNIKSSLFEHQLDQAQFVNIFKLLQESSLLQKMSIPSAINKEIAEYSVGRWVEHKHPDCNIIMSVMHEDIEHLKDRSQVECISSIGFDYYDDIGYRPYESTNNHSFECLGCEQNCWLDKCEDCDEIVICTDGVNIYDSWNLYWYCICMKFLCDACNVDVCDECMEFFCNDCLSSECQCCKREYCENCIVNRGIYVDIGYCIMCGAKNLCGRCIILPEKKRLESDHDNIKCICKLP